MSIRDIPNSVALPQSAQMKLKPNAVPARRTRLSIQPYTQPGPTTDIGTSSQLIQFYVPARRNCMYDPQTMYLKGTITNVTTTVADRGILNRNAFSLLNRLQVYGQDSTLLEDIQNYNDLCHTLMDVQMEESDKAALSTMYGGNNYAQTLYSGQAAGAVNSPAANIPFASTVATVKSGADLGTPMAAADVLHFCIPVVSAFGLLSDNLIPVGWLNSDLRFDFYTESCERAFRGHDVAYANNVACTAYRLRNLELVVDQIEFDPSSMAIVNQFAPVNGPLFCHATTWKTYSTALANANSFSSNLVPHRSLSVKQHLAICHPTAWANNAGLDYFIRILPYGGSNTDAQLALNIGGQKYPQKPIALTNEIFAELQKSQHAFNQLVLNGSINREDFVKYNADVSIGSAGERSNSHRCKPVIGFDLEIYDKKGSTIINGQNWTGLNVFIEGFLSNAAAGNAALAAGATLLNFINYDVIYVIQDGTISVRF